jgi:hypothetical protein
MYSSFRTGRLQPIFGERPPRMMLRDLTRRHPHGHTGPAGLAGARPPLVPPAPSDKRRDLERRSSCIIGEEMRKRNKVSLDTHSSRAYDAAAYPKPTRTNRHARSTPQRRGCT